MLNDANVMNIECSTTIRAIYYAITVSEVYKTNNTSWLKTYIIGPFWRRMWINAPRMDQHASRMCHARRPYICDYFPEFGSPSRGNKYEFGSPSWGNSRLSKNTGILILLSIQLEEVVERIALLQFCYVSSSRRSRPCIRTFSETLSKA